MNWSVSVFLREEKPKKNGECPIYLRLIVKRAKKDIALHISCKVENWDAAERKIKGRTQFTEKYNYLIEREVSRLKEILLDQEIRDRPFSIDTIYELYSGNEKKKSSRVVEFAKQYLIENKANYTTLNSYNTRSAIIRKIERYSSKVLFEDISADWLRKYSSYHKRQGNKPNTIGKDLRFLRVIWNAARRAGIAKHYPFKDFTLPSENTHREYLELAEVQILEKLLAGDILNNSQKNVLKYGLFSCYTSLRYSDIYALRQVDIKNGFIKVRQIKTGHFVEIPLIDKAKLLIGSGAAGKVFKVFSNQKTNEYLKEIIALAGIPKKISFHCLRHTFAMIALNELGMPLEVVQSLMGHNSIKTTQIYARIKKNTLIRNMDKWNNIG